MSKITHIFHFADIHIGSDPNRHNEYITIFKTIKSQLENHAYIATALCVVCGDIFHHKSHYSGDDVRLFDIFMSVLANQAPTVIIPGNHDLNIQNTSRIDLITPIISKLQTKYPIYYSTKTEEFTFHSIYFYHIHVADLKPNLPTTISNHDTTILLYHGSVIGATFGKHIVTESVISQDFIKLFDMVLLGDIHEHQCIKQHIAYPGSLIQQNLGESVKKGFIVWDVKDRYALFNILPNTSAMLRLDIRGMNDNQVQQLIVNTNRPNSILKLSVICDSNTPTSTLNKITSQVGAITYVRRYDTVKIDVVATAKQGLATVLQQLGADEQTINEIVQLQNPISTQRNWSLVSLSWDNMFRYGANNHIDFTQLSGLTGIIARNTAGKSSIFDILIFVLWGKLIRGDVKTAIHDGAKSSYIECIFIADKKYKVTRQDTKTKHSKVKLFRYDGDIETDLTGVSITHTYTTIRNIIGDHISFQLVNMFNDLTLDIITMSDTDRSKYLMSIFGLTEITSKIKSIKDEIRQLQQARGKLIIPRCETRVVQDTMPLEQELKHLQSILASLDPTVKSVESIDIELAKLGDLPEPPYVATVSKPNPTATDIQLANSLCPTRPSNLIQTEINQMPKISNTRLIEDIELDLSKSKQLELKPSNEHTIRQLEQSLSPITHDQYLKLKEDNTPTPYTFIFDDQCTHCNTNRQLCLETNLIKEIHPDIQHKIWEYESNGDIKRRIAALKQQESTIRAHNINTKRVNEKREILITEHNECKKSQEHFQELNKKRAELTTSIKYETAVKLIAQLEQYNKYIAWKKWSDIQQHKLQLQLQREYSKTKYCTPEYYNFQQQKCNELNRTIGKQQTENIEIEKENNIIVEYNSKVPTIDAQLKKLSIYLEAITSTKLRNIVISTGMKTIMEILNTICTTCGFTVEMQQAEEITFNICNKTTKLPIKMASGMQKFVISLAMRLAICQVLPTPTFMFVDEGFDAVDNDNMIALKNNLHELAANCSFIFIVSHKESLQNTLVKPLFITQHTTHSHTTNVAVATVAPVRQNIHCECGAIVARDKYSKHIKTKKHLINQRLS